MPCSNSCKLRRKMCSRNANYKELQETRSALAYQVEYLEKELKEVKEAKQASYQDLLHLFQGQSIQHTGQELNVPQQG